MAFPGLVRANNLSDIVDRERAWNNLGSGITDDVITFTVKGRDILALEGVRNTSTRDFVFIKGLTAAAQPRITAAANNASSAATSQSNALLKLSPTSIGDYFANRGSLVASGLSVNGSAVASLALSPFSGSTALFPLSIASLKLSSDVRWTQAMSSGSIASPDRAIPVETDQFILYAKAGQN